MKPLSIAILLLAATTASSFVANRSPATKTSVLRSTDLEGMWDELKKTERDIIVQTAVDEQEDTGTGWGNTRREAVGNSSGICKDEGTQ